MERKKERDREELRGTERKRDNQEERPRDTQEKRPRKETDRKRKRDRQKERKRPRESVPYTLLTHDVGREFSILIEERRSSGRDGQVRTVRDSDFSLGWCDPVWRADSKRVLRRNVPTYPRCIEKTGTTASQLF